MNVEIYERFVRLCYEQGVKVRRVPMSGSPEVLAPYFAHERRWAMLVPHHIAKHIDWGKLGADLHYFGPDGALVSCRVAVDLWGDTRWHNHYVLMDGSCKYRCVGDTAKWLVVSHWYSVLRNKAAVSRALKVDRTHLYRIKNLKTLEDIDANYP